jgi:hypothetical protein
LGHGLLHIVQEITCTKKYVIVTRRYSEEQKYVIFMFGPCLSALRQKITARHEPVAPASIESNAVRV